jgi:hypothetical protein
MKPTYIAYTNTYVYNFQTCGFHPTLKNKLYMDETTGIYDNLLKCIIHAEDKR